MCIRDRSRVLKIFSSRLHYHNPVAETKTRRIGLARALSKLGYCSRSQAAQLIRSGHVTLNGKPRRDPETPVMMQQDEILSLIHISTRNLSRSRWSHS